MSAGGRLRVVAMAGLAVALIGAGLALPSAAADAPGTVDVNRIPSRTPDIDVLGASPAGVLYRHLRSSTYPGSGPTYLKPTGKPAIRVDSRFEFLAGDKIYTRSGDQGPTYLVIGSSTERTCPAAPLPVLPEGWHDRAPFTPFGWLTESGQQVTADANGCRITGTGPAIPKYKLAASDKTGYVLFDSQAQDGTVSMSYHTYDAPGTAHPIQTGGHSKYPFGVDLDGTVVTWAETLHIDLDTAHSYVVRSSTTGGSAKVTLVKRMVDNTAINGSAVGWAACKWSIIKRCTAGSISSTGVTTEVLDSRTVASDGTRFFVDTYGASPGVDSAAVVDGKSWTRLVTLGLVPPYTFGVDAAAGQVTYVDDQGQPAGVSNYVLARRPVGAGLTLGAQKTVVPRGSIGESVISRDGDRTAYFDANDDLWLRTDGGTSTRVYDAQEKVGVVQARWPSPLTLSGHRLLWVKGIYTEEHCEPWGCYPIYGKSRLMMFDLRTGKNVDLGATTSTRPAALWGNYLVTTDSTNRVWRKDLSSGAVVQVKAAGPRVAGLDVNGTIVAWSTCAPVGEDKCGVSKVGYKVVSRTAPAVERAGLGSAKVSLTGGHLAYTTIASNQSTLRSWRLGTSASTEIGRTFHESDAIFFEAHDETLAWIGADRTARLTPLAAFTARPRYLGNASGAASFKPSLGQRWSPSFPISKALPTCTITIKSGSALQRSLPCATTTGIARASWDGKDTSGRLVAKGKYTWTLTASDPDGALLWWNGSATPITGTITVTRTHRPSVRHASGRSRAKLDASRSVRRLRPPLNT